MLRIASLASLVLTVAGCGWRDPRVPLDEARCQIDTIQANQQQAGLLLTLQQDLQRDLLANPRVHTASVGLYFGSEESRPYSARLVVQFVILMDLNEVAPQSQEAAPASQPATEPAQVKAPTSIAQDVVRQAILQCGWDIERVDDYQYENHCRVRGQLRGAGKPPAAGAGLDILPERKVP
jgi:hypothetical protein